jgi:hypothetical protein
MIPRGLIRQADAARHLGLSRQRVHALIRRGRIGTITYKGQIFVAEQSLRLFEADREQRSRRTNG